MTSGTLAGHTIVMSGGSRGIGLAIALRAAQDGANVVLLAKTGEPHARLPGTVHTAAAEIETRVRTRKTRRNAINGTSLRGQRQR